MKRFGEGWSQTVHFELVPTPVGEACLHCKVPVRIGELGVILPFSGGTIEKPIETEAVYHRECLLRSMGIED